MSEAKDTILSLERRDYFRLKAQKAVEDYYKTEGVTNYNLIPKRMDEHAKQLCYDVALEELTEQAEVAFQAGQQARIRESPLPTAVTDFYWTD